ncbi:MAG: NADP-dependent phosphogluconate dehydrogenase [Alphaproteobacteria bacterium]|nr:NADP-dependent phosphogluconate dehydrogenase [Alphaproteobacteria bacterium]
MSTPSASASPALGLVGLGTMGANLARNFARNGARLALFDTDRARGLALAAGVGRAASATDSLDALVAALPAPRTVFLMVPAGPPVDEALAALLPRLAPGDAVIDGGNSFWRDTERRAATARARGVDFLGFGISGGAEGALKGPAIMAGGEAAALARLAPLFEAAAARHAGIACFTRCGPGGAGHFVKMVHNGIEYAVMQLLAEAYLLLRDDHGLGAADIGRHFDGWRGTMADSFLLDCARRVLAARDGDAALVDLIVDAAEQKGTGTWTAAAALEFGVPAPTLAEAVFARGISFQRTTRHELARERAGTGVSTASAATASAPSGPGATAADLAAALPAASLVAHVQGLALIAAASTAQGWRIDLAAVARGWRAGCILRSPLIEQVAESLAAAPDPMRLLHEPPVVKGTEAWRRVVARAVGAAHAVPVLASALAYLDGFTTRQSGANLIQGMRDVFGRHGLKRTDKPGTFNAEWPEA